MNWLLVFIGGGLGSLLRYAVRVLAARVAGAGSAETSHWLWATLAVNVVGCFLGGALLRSIATTRVGAIELSDHARLFLLTGILGGFTTFSAFGVETLELLHAGRARDAALNIAGNVVLALLACGLGYWSMSMLSGRSPGVQ